MFGKNNMGGNPGAGRVFASGSGVDGNILGAVGGSQYIQAHSHGIADPGHTHEFLRPTYTSDVDRGTLGSAWSLDIAEDVNTAPNGTGITILDHGQGTSQNMPPTIILNYLIYTGTDPAVQRQPVDLYSFFPGQLTTSSVSSFLLTRSITITEGFAGSVAGMTSVAPDDVTLEIFQGETKIGEVELATDGDVAFSQVGSNDINLPAGTRITIRPEGAVPDNTIDVCVTLKAFREVQV